MSGKGSAPRPFSVTDEQFAEAWERIFRKDKDGQGESHPDGESDEVLCIRLDRPENQ